MASLTHLLSCRPVSQECSRADLFHGSVASHNAVAESGEMCGCRTSVKVSSDFSVHCRSHIHFLSLGDAIFFSSWPREPTPMRGSRIHSSRTDLGKLHGDNRLK
jgi:hypothetical protein